MAINLKKGQTIDLRKNDRGESFDLSKVTIGLGWDVKQKGGFMKKLFGSGKEVEYDLDATAFLLGENGKVNNRGNEKLVGGDVVFFNSLKHPSGNIWLTGDNTTGAGDGDDEEIIVKLDSLDQKYRRIVFMVSIYKGKQKNQNFSMVENAFIRAVDGTGREIAKFNLSADSTSTGMCSMIFAEVYRNGNEWKFKAIGELKATDNFVEILKSYI